MKKKMAGFLFACAAAVFVCGAASAKESESAATATETETVEGDAAGATDVLLDDLYSFQMMIDGEVYQFPMAYEEFTAYGWEYSDEDYEITPNSYTSETFRKDGLEAYVTVYNLGINTAVLSQCTVGGMSIDSWQFEDAPEGTSIEFPCGIAYGVSTLEDVKAAYGEPSDTYEGELYTSLTYEYDSYQEIEFYIDKESGVMDEFDLRNMVEDSEANAAAAAEVSDEPTEEVLSYTAPTELGDDLQSFIVEYAGDLYQMPAPVSVFLENGWTLKEEDSDSIVAGNYFGWVYMMKENQELGAIARNYSANATTIENCFVTSVEGNVNGTNLPITVQKGITLNMSEDDFLAAVEGLDYELEDSSDTYAYYNFEGSESSLDGVQVIVNKEEGTVIGIEVSCEPDSLD